VICQLCTFFQIHWVLKHSVLQKNYWVQRSNVDVISILFNMRFVLILLLLTEKF
jgi:hypothetical protein